MKITKRQLRRIIREEKSRLLREFEVPHESQAFAEDHPDWQSGYNDGSSGRARRDGQTPEYYSGFEEGLSDAYYDGTDHGYIGEQKQRLSEQVHQMYQEDDELRQLGEIIENLMHYALEGSRIMDDMGMRYGELVGMGTDARIVKNSIRELADKFDMALDNIVRYR
tara:strand:- start:446 stop:943 length:498 start_codon:yes stop_codon:yes gene_type:complete